MRILVLGADGYLGWPTCLYFAKKGHEVHAFDNGSKRRILNEMDRNTLAPVPSFRERLSAWNGMDSGRIMGWEDSLCGDFERLKTVLRLVSPEIIVHYAEQPSAPFSMMSASNAEFTQRNNILGTLNLIFAMKEECPSAQLLKLGCYDDETEVLTKRGWVLFKDIVKKDFICCLDQDTEEIQYHYPLEIVNYKYSGKMFRIKTKSIDCLITPNHRVVLRRDLNKDVGPIEIHKADSLPNINFRIPRGGRWLATDVLEFVLPSVDVRKAWGHKDKRESRKFSMDIWLKFFGLWIAEGCVRKNKGHPIATQLAAKKVSTVNAIRDSIKGLGLNFCESVDHTGMRTFEVYGVHLATYLNRFGKARDKYIPEELKDCSKRQLKILYDSLMEGDGHFSPSGTGSYWSISDRLLGDVQEIALKIGKAATLCKSRGEHYLIIGHNVNTRVLKSAKKEWVDYDGIVYCCKVSTGIMLVRRNGRVCWSGNTMGEYGTPNIRIEEGWIEIEHKGRKDRLLYPKRAGSFYHLSKVHDSHNLEFVCRIWGLRVTDLNQGVVYGFCTKETSYHSFFSTMIYYDDIFGTVLNRFIAQAVSGVPLTVYGKGGQTRGFLNIRDTLRCVELAALHPAEPGEFRVFNQFTETFSVLNLAEMVVNAASVIGLGVELEHIENPRVESEEHFYEAENSCLMSLGLEPVRLTVERIQVMLEFAARYEGRILKDAILPTVSWV